MIVPDVEAAPTLRMAISKTLLTPAPKLPLCDVRIERSGPSVTESVEELLVVFESPVIATVAVLVIVPVAEALTPTTRGIVAAEVPGTIGP